MTDTAAPDPRQALHAEKKATPAEATTAWWRENPGAIRFVKACDKNIRKTLALANDMIELADRGDADREDVGCGILYGVLRDSAFKLKKLAETEKRNHRLKARAIERPPKSGATTACPPAFRPE